MLVIEIATKIQSESIEAVQVENSKSDLMKGRFGSDENAKKAWTDIDWLPDISAKKPSL